MATVKYNNNNSAAYGAHGAHGAGSRHILAWLCVCLALLGVLRSNALAAELNDNMLREYITGGHHYAVFPTALEMEESVELPPLMDNDETSNENKHNNNHHSHAKARHCEIEMTHRIKGICQTVRPMSNACVSGEYVDLLNAECM